MIEILGVRDPESGNLSITPQLAAMACNIIRQYCLQQETCTGCVFGGRKSLNCSLSGVPGGCWPDLEVTK